jgi:hypothetical protein
MQNQLAARGASVNKDLYGRVQKFVDSKEQTEYHARVTKFFLTE